MSCQPRRRSRTPPSGWVSGVISRPLPAIGRHRAMFTKPCLAAAPTWSPSRSSRPVPGRVFVARDRAEREAPGGAFAPPNTMGLGRRHGSRLTLAPDRTAALRCRPPSVAASPCWPNYRLERPTTACEVGPHATGPDDPNAYQKRRPILDCSGRGLRPFRGVLPPRRQWHPGIPWRLAARPTQQDAPAPSAAPAAQAVILSLI